MLLPVCAAHYLCCLLSVLLTICVAYCLSLTGNNSDEREVCRALPDRTPFVGKESQGTKAQVTNA